MYPAAVCSRASDHVGRSVLRPPPLLGRPQSPGSSQVLHHALKAGPGPGRDHALFVCSCYSLETASVRLLSNAAPAELRPCHFVRLITAVTCTAPRLSPGPGPAATTSTGGATRAAATRRPRAPTRSTTASTGPAAAAPSCRASSPRRCWARPRCPALGRAAARGGTRWWRAAAADTCTARAAATHPPRTAGTQARLTRGTAWPRQSSCYARAAIRQP